VCGETKREKGKKEEETKGEREGAKEKSGNTKQALRHW